MKTFPLNQISFKIDSEKENLNRRLRPKNCILRGRDKSDENDEFSLIQAFKI